MQEADCSSSPKNAEAIGVKEYYYLSIKEESVLVRIETRNAVGVSGGDTTRLPIGLKAEWINDGNLSIELADSEKQTFELSSDWETMTADDVAFSPTGCQNGRYRLRLTKLESSAEVWYASKRAKALTLGKNGTVSNQTLNQPGNYKLYSIRTDRDEEYDFILTGQQDEYRLNLYNAKGQARSGSGHRGSGCPAGSEDSYCISGWNYFLSGRYYLLVTALEVNPSDSNFTLETRSRLAPED
ncbi:MAG: hypothetical protein ACQES2_02060 [Pseudomonadota bacterium]